MSSQCEIYPTSPPFPSLFFPCLFFLLYLFFLHLLNIYPFVFCFVYRPDYYCFNFLFPSFYVFMFGWTNARCWKYTNGENTGLICKLAQMLIRKTYISRNKTRKYKNQSDMFIPIRNTEEHEESFCKEIMPEHNLNFIPAAFIYENDWEEGVASRRASLSKHKGVQERPYY